MNEERCDVNFFLGSWGPQPEDEPAPLMSIPAEELLSSADWSELEARWVGFMLLAIRRGDADEAAWRAAWVVRYHRLGGH